MLKSASADGWRSTLQRDTRFHAVHDALLDRHRVRLLINQAQRGSVTAFSWPFLISDQARLETRFHALVEELIQHYARNYPAQALFALTRALAQLQDETAAFAEAVEQASIGVRAQRLALPNDETSAAGEARLALADACAEMVVQSCLTTIRRGPADCTVQFRRMKGSGRWLAERPVLIIPPQVCGSEGTIALPPVILRERMPLEEFADSLVRRTALSFPLGLLAPFPGWETPAQWRRVSGRSAVVTGVADIVAMVAPRGAGGAETADFIATIATDEPMSASLPMSEPVGGSHQTDQSAPFLQSSQPTQPFLAIPALISAGTHQLLYPCRSDALGVMWPAFACELFDPDDVTCVAAMSATTTTAMVQGSVRQRRVC